MIEGKAADVIVIGGGIIGAACADELARHGVNVLVLDCQRPAATAAGMGHLVVLDHSPAELALGNYSVGLWRELAPHMPDDCALRTNGTLWLACNDQEMVEAERKHAALNEYGMACELLTGAEVADAEPALRPGLAGALRVAGDGILYAPNAARWLLQRQPRQVRQQRAEVVDVQGPRVRLADGQWLQADAVVLANGIHARTLCPELPLEPKKGHLLITDRYPARITHTLVELGYVTSAHQGKGPSVAFNVQQRPTGQLFVGSSRQFDQDDAAIDAAMLGRMLRRAMEFLPDLGTLNGIRSWTGLRAASPDGQPLIGEHPAQPGLWLAVGHEGLGVTTATGTARLLAAQLLRAPLPEPLQAHLNAFLPQRFIGASAHA
ncbi:MULTISPECIES: FAD-binding oxidoreductase [unclassified Pseudomonas]|uniref:NAD(P)/FAD-dependent oxidoreductase n=1 Tax=unclassified Pseudomonas TaxID=196821 RepID=UPI000D35E73B|nr:MULTISPECIES: FAD-binding oxidoreductase [unclassified Pseudomonas]RAU47551.1 FAD-binding oxidoreductase [Pseudomonas sp. RIT 409]RAU49058.1 FAD-binding oxidoreductase [Pseudomonas sp. RIT 412]